MGLFAKIIDGSENLEKPIRTPLRCCSNQLL